MNKKVGFVALVGRANVGKSSLLNAILGEKISIISPTVQTTRITIKGIKNIDNSQIVFLDTPGLHKPYDKMGTLMNNESIDSLIQSDIICLLYPVDEYSGKGDLYILNLLKENKINKPVFALITKIDKENKSKILLKIDYLSKIYNFSEIIPLSAKTKENIDLLEKKLIEYLPYKENKIFEDDKTYLKNDKFFIEEFIREKIYIFFKEEIPHSTLVKIDALDVTINTIYINATIYVEREGQKAILIGNKGSMIKKIRLNSQKDLKKFFDKKVVLDLVIKVKNKWREKNLLNFKD